MKKKIIILGICAFICGINQVEAKNNKTLDDIENGFKSKIEEVNENSTCYNSVVKRTSENEVAVYYSSKEDSSDLDKCVEPRGWNFKIENGPSYAFFDSFLWDNEKLFSGVDTSELEKLDIMWFDIFTEIMNYGFTFSDLSESRGLIEEKDFYYYLYYASSVINPDGISGFRFLLNHDVLEVDSTTTNSIKLKYNQYATSLDESAEKLLQISIDGEEYHDVKDSDIKYTNGLSDIELLNLNPNTKYYIKMNSTIYREKIVEATTLSIPEVPDDKRDPVEEKTDGEKEPVEDKPDDKKDPVEEKTDDEKEPVEDKPDDKKDSVEDEPNNKDEVENPDTGIMIPMGIILLGLISIIIIKQRKSIIYKI